jgi:hypothetical protein
VAPSVQPRRVHADRARSAHVLARAVADEQRLARLDRELAQDALEDRGVRLAPPDLDRDRDAGEAAVEAVPRQHLAPRRSVGEI